MLWVVFALLLSVDARTGKFVLESSSVGIKLYNNDTISVDVSEWQMQGEDGFTYVFPQGTVIPPRGFIVIPDRKATEITILSTNKERIVSIKYSAEAQHGGDTFPADPYLASQGFIKKCKIPLQSEEHKNIPSKPLLIRRLYNWFNPAIETENNFTQPNAQTKVVGGTANQKFLGPLTLGLGGKYVKKSDKTETYLGLTNLRLDLKKFGNLGIHHEHLLKGEEIGEHPQKTILTWSIPTMFGLTLSLNREHRWSDKFKADFSSIGVERALGNNTAFYTRHSLQSFVNGFQAAQGMAGARNTVNITKKLRLITSAELWRNIETYGIYYRAFNSALEYFSTELSRFSIATYTHLRPHEHNPILQLTVLLPVKFGLYFGAREELNYYMPKEKESWYCLKRCTGIAYIPSCTNKFRIVGNITENKTPWEGYRVTEAFKIIMYPIRMVRTSIKYTYTNDGELGSVWVKYLNKYFELGIGGRALHNNELTNSTNYGLSVEGGIKQFKKFSFVCGYKAGYNLIGIEDQGLVDNYYRNRNYYVKINLSENSFEALFEEE